MKSRHSGPAILVLVLVSLAGGQSLTEVLTVEVEGQTYGAAWLGPGAFGGVTGLVSTGQTKIWKGFRGGLPVSEAEFYRTAGYNDIAEKAESRKGTSDCLTWGGLGTCIAGLALLVVAAVKVGESGEGQPGLAIAGVGGALGGLTVELIGVSMRGHLTPASFAVRVAEEYNDRLRR
ncbi:hypothetical protein FJY68_01110 [candidate division WOR-3 bacterium]|uniref:Uncharacterized protein n=1 Tax=candidate division WOR-3 bacterium TaxID=2052148 RepID=A0A938BNR4_UNCW3|nr:hypothetical protein [candidate division WOR-3 bacterium]